jgi:tRNA(His) guanylyltransferase
LLFRGGINFNDLPNWQKGGIGLYWEEYEKEGFNPITKENTFIKRRRIKRDLELPMKDAYSIFITSLLNSGCPAR